jgi:spermidine synthase
MPDPDETATAKLYSVEFYAMVKKALAPGGRVVVQSGSPYFAQRSYWCVGATLAAAGLTTVPYHVDVPSFGDWGFFLAADGVAPPLGLDPPPTPLRFLDADVQVPPSTLMDPRILQYAREEWKGY